MRKYDAISTLIADRCIVSINIAIYYLQPPVSVTSWNGTLNATQFGNACSQSKKYLPSSIVDSEDCLTLNVYVPKVCTIKIIDRKLIRLLTSIQSIMNQFMSSSHLSIFKVANATATLPVMIYLHGGAFKGAWASLYKPNYILEEDVILVVPQFRLGPLGEASKTLLELTLNLIA